LLSGAVSVFLLIRCYWRIHLIRVIWDFPGKQRIILAKSILACSLLVEFIFHNFGASKESNLLRLLYIFKCFLLLTFIHGLKSAHSELLVLILAHHRLTFLAPFCGFEPFAGGVGWVLIQKSIWVNFDLVFELSQALHLRLQVEPVSIKEHLRPLLLELSFGALGKRQLDFIVREVAIANWPEISFLVPQSILLDNQRQSRGLNILVKDRLLLFWLLHLRSCCGEEGVGLRVSSFARQEPRLL